MACWSVPPWVFQPMAFGLFLALFAAGASAFLAYIYVAAAGETMRRTDREITREMGRRLKGRN